jgi:hypothetical protein
LNLYDWGWMNRSVWNRNWKSESNWVQKFHCGLAIAHTRAIPTLKSQKYFLNL